MILYFSRNPNPRLAVAVARHLNSPVTFEFAAPFAPGQAERFSKMNPNLSIPILQEVSGTLWEADAIACRLSWVAGSDFWRSGDQEPDMIRWLSWGKANFVQACDIVHFELGTKQRYGLGPVDETRVDEGMRLFRSAAPILDAHLSTRHWLTGDSVCYADFRMASFLPFNNVARLPVGDYPSICRWYSRLEDMKAWRSPFQGLNAPALPSIPVGR